MNEWIEFIMDLLKMAIIVVIFIALGTAFLMLLIHGSVALN